MMGGNDWEVQEALVPAVVMDRSRGHPWQLLCKGLPARYCPGAASDPQAQLQTSSSSRTPNLISDLLTFQYQFERRRSEPKVRQFVDSKRHTVHKFSVRHT